MDLDTLPASCCLQSSTPPAKHSLSSITGLITADESNIDPIMFVAIATTTSTKKNHINFRGGQNLFLRMVFEF
jgi:hypothetical protein